MDREGTGTAVMGGSGLVGFAVLALSVVTITVAVTVTVALSFSFPSGNLVLLEGTMALLLHVALAVKGGSRAWVQGLAIHRGRLREASMQRFRSSIKAPDWGIQGSLQLSLRSYGPSTRSHLPRQGLLV